MVYISALTSTTCLRKFAESHISSTVNPTVLHCILTRPLTSYLKVFQHVCKLFWSTTNVNVSLDKSFTHWEFSQCSWSIMTVYFWRRMFIFLINYFGVSHSFRNLKLFILNWGFLIVVYCWTWIKEPKCHLIMSFTYFVTHFIIPLYVHACLTASQATAPCTGAKTQHKMAQETKILWQKQSISLDGSGEIMSKVTCSQAYLSCFDFHVIDPEIVSCWLLYIK